MIPHRPPNPTTPPAHIADEETEALRWDGRAWTHAVRGGVMATGLWIAAELGSPVGSGRTDWWEGSQDAVGWRSGTRVDMMYSAPGLTGR